MKSNVIGMDIAKQVFQLHTVDLTRGELERIKLRRAAVPPFFAQRPSSLVAMEACGSAHHWARQLRAPGHEVRLLAPNSVRPFVRVNKTDAADAHSTIGLEQTRRYVLARAAHPRSPRCHCTRQTLAADRGVAQAASLQRSGRGVGQYTGAHNLGSVGSRTTL